MKRSLRILESLGRTDLKTYNSVDRAAGDCCKNVHIVAVQQGDMNHRSHNDE
jgi:hypothetical protein